MHFLAFYQWKKPKFGCEIHIIGHPICWLVLWWLDEEKIVLLREIGIGSGIIKAGGACFALVT